MLSSNLDSISMVTALNTLEVAKINKMSITATCNIPKKKAARIVKRQRDYDYLYGKCILQTRKRRHLETHLFDVSFVADPVFTVSSEVDHYRSSLKARASKDRVVSHSSLNLIYNTLLCN